MKCSAELYLPMGATCWLFLKLAANCDRKIMQGMEMPGQAISLHDEAYGFMLFKINPAGLQ